MARQRKTFELKALVDSVNEKLSLESLTWLEKSVLCTLLEDFLFRANCYRGFKFNDNVVSGSKNYNRTYYYNG